MSMKNMRQILSKQKGFTLVELMVVMAIFSIVVMLGSGFTRQAIDVNVKAKTRENLQYNVVILTNTIREQVKDGSTVLELPKEILEELDIEYMVIGGVDQKDVIDQALKDNEDVIEIPSHIGSLDEGKTSISASFGMKDDKNVWSDHTMTIISTFRANDDLSN